MNNPALHHHNHNPLGGYHVCMWEGPSYTPSALQVNHDALRAQHDANTDEIHRLRALLSANDIEWTKPASESSNSTASKFSNRQQQLRQTTLSPWTRSAAAKQKSAKEGKPLPQLPMEVLLRILKAAVTSSRPVIDPFWTLLPENMTANEQSHSSLNLGLLSTCKAFREEGIKFFITQNRFIFTQVEALQNFVNFSPEARSSIKHITVRVVAKYFDTSSYKKVLRGNSSYHSLQEALTVWVKARPATSKDKGIQAYAWQQMVDFLQAFVISSGASKPRQHLLTGLKSMRIDLVNFSEHIPFLGSPFISIIRWHIGRLLEELIVTGMADEEVSNGEERFLGFLVKRNGLLGTGCPVFSSARADRLKTLPGYGLHLQIVKPTFKTSQAETNLSDPFARSPITHPIGGSPPVSIFPPEFTVWKYTSDNLSKPQKRWIEFHRQCGLPVDECGELQAMLEILDEDEEIVSGSGSVSDSDSPMNFDAWEEAGLHLEQLSDVE